MSSTEIELKNYVVPDPKRKKVIHKKQDNNTLENYDPTINDATPIVFSGNELYCDEPSNTFADLYSMIFNRKDDFIKNKNFPQYWNCIITEIQAEEHTGIIKKSMINKTEIEKRKSIIKFMKRLINDIDDE